MTTERFNPSDLRANRNGTLSEAQRAYVRRRVRRELAVTLGGILLADAFLVGAVLFSYSRLETQPEGEGLLLQVYTMIGTQIIVGLGFLYQAFLKPLLRRVGKVQTLSGTLEVQVVNTDTTVYHYIRLNKRSLRVEAHEAALFEIGRPYTLYFTHAPNSEILLSWEAQSGR